MSVSSYASAHELAEAVQCPRFCFSNPTLRECEAAFDRLGMPLVTSGQFAYVFKLNHAATAKAYAVRCFRQKLDDRAERYRLISAHLRKHPVAAISLFDYEPEGILVSGRRFPILVMPWIQGSTLDVYLNEVYRKREAVEHLAREWVKLMRALHESNVAHGDLQHGNIIVE